MIHDILRYTQYCIQGAAVLRMMEDIFGEDVFKMAIQVGYLV